jgi:hypothetical protein
MFDDHLVSRGNDMLTGNPDTFAIWCDQVDSWSTDKFSNGCFGYFIAGNLVRSLRSTLGVDFHRLNLLHVMNHRVEDQSLFELPDQDAYFRLHKMAFPDQYSDSPVNDFTHLISTESMSDEENYIFLVEFKDEAKIISGYKDHASTVLSVSLQQGEFQKIVREATEKFKLMRN